MARPTEEGKWHQRGQECACASPAGEPAWVTEIRMWWAYEKGSIGFLQVTSETIGLVRRRLHVSDIILLVLAVARTRLRSPQPFGERRYHPLCRGGLDATSADRKSRLPDRFTRDSPCSRKAILGTPSQPTRPIRAGRLTPVRAPPSAQWFRSIRCARRTRRHPVKIRRQWTPETSRLEGQGRSRWIMRLARRAPLLPALSLLISAATAHAEYQGAGDYFTWALGSATMRRKGSSDGHHDHHHRV